MAQAETAGLRDYLDDLRRRAVEGDEFARLDAEIRGTHDPMERIRLVDRRRQVAERRRELEEAFVRHARPWALAAGVRRAAFLEEGVPAPVLDRARIDE